MFAQTASSPAASGTRLKIGVALEGGGALGVLNTGTPLYFQGAPLRLSAYGTNEF